METAATLIIQHCVQDNGTARRTVSETVEGRRPQHGCRGRRWWTAASNSPWRPELSPVRLTSQGSHPRGGGAPGTSN